MIIEWNGIPLKEYRKCGLSDKSIYHDPAISYHVKFCLLSGEGVLSLQDRVKILDFCRENFSGTIERWSKGYAEEYKNGGLPLSEFIIYLVPKPFLAYYVTEAIDKLFWFIYYVVGPASGSDKLRGLYTL